jgi:2-polyprenyl-3-methyl-5-hydroxy-6-metoxy-1,4-benzoquinol methylase
MTSTKRHPASFRDPSGFVFEKDGIFYRQVNQSYAPHYTRLMQSGLYTALIKEKSLLAHTETDNVVDDNSRWFKTILPEQLTFISHPYEWCFSQWKDAALLTLSIAIKSIGHGLILKDATPFNIQFKENAPVWIDTLSFEIYDETKPWIAYRQFIECFIAPLLIARYLSADLQKLFMIYPEGIPLKILAKLLPAKSRLNLNALMHVILPSNISGNKKGVSKKIGSFSKQKLLHIINNLNSFVQSIKIRDESSVWNNYYEETVLSTDYVEEKMSILKRWIEPLPVKSVLDAGTNTGHYAEMTSAAGKFTVAVDGDTACIDHLYNHCKKNKRANLLPLVIDITTPSPSIGWENQERTSFLSRSKTDLVLALALIHHLAITRNVGFEQMASLFSSLAPWLIIEFVPKSDPKINLLLQNRPDIFDDYNETNFIHAFAGRFSIVNKQTLTNSGRVLFLMQRKEGKSEI